MIGHWHYLGERHIRHEHAEGDDSHWHPDNEVMGAYMLPVLEVKKKDNIEYCTEREDKQHCVCWWDCGPCCDCRYNPPHDSDCDCSLVLQEGF